MEINQEKINYYINRGYINTDDDVKFKYIVEILRLFNVKVNGWMKGGYILNEKEGIMFSKADNINWNDKVDDKYMYECCSSQIGKRIEKVNKYWGEKIIYIFRKENKEGYKFIGCFKQDTEKLEELFDKEIIDERPYKRVGTEINLKKFN